MLSAEEVLKIARLARLELTPAEVELYRSRLGRVLEYVKDLAAVPTAGEDGFVKHIPKDAVALREDMAVRFTDTELLLKNSPALEENQFLLPTIVEREE